VGRVETAVRWPGSCGRVSSCWPLARGGWWCAATSGHSHGLPARGASPIRAGRPV